MSGQSDHDRALERLLRAIPGGPADSTPACIDAEQLATWAEGGLTPVERDAIEAHVASCARCLAMLAVFSDSQPESVANSAAPKPGGSVRETGRVLRWPMKWVVPITTAAAAVLIWMVLPARPPDRTLAPASEVARDENAAAAPAAPAPQRFDAPSGDQARESPARQTPAAPTPEAPRALSKTIAPPEGPERRRDQAPVTENVQLKPGQETAARPADSSSLAGQRAANETAMSDRMSTPQPAAPPPSAQVMSEQSSVAQMRAVVAPVEIQSPDPARRWRIRGALVERSTNGGSSWQPVKVPARSIVTAGTSPSSNVCWLVGPNGTVLRTANGTEFEAVTTPAAVSLVSVQASDADHATVRTADGNTFVTEDGGRTWR